MGAFLVVIEHPRVSGLPDFGQILELIQVEQFVPIGPAETFDVRALVRFSGWM